MCPPGMPWAARSADAAMHGDAGLLGVQVRLSRFYDALHSLLARSLPDQLLFQVGQLHRTVQTVSAVPGCRRCHPEGRALSRCLRAWGCRAAWRPSQALPAVPSQPACLIPSRPACSSRLPAADRILAISMHFQCTCNAELSELTAFMACWTHPCQNSVACTSASCTAQRIPWIL